MSEPQRPPAAGQESDETPLSAAETSWSAPGEAACPEALTPAQIGSYRVERCLGRGGMGEVFLAWDERLGRRVAIKRIRPDAGLPLTQRERFRREARAVARLSHSAIVQVYDLMSDATGDAIVLEYVEGVTLAARIAGGPLAPAEAVRLGRQIADGLAAAHGAGLIHRDLKAENVIVTPSGQAKILDFGLARPVGQNNEESALTEHGAVLGTYHAMSPEQAGGGEVDERSDLFSLGSLLYQMLTGRAPFRGTSALETLKRVLTETPPSLPAIRPEVPAELAALVDRLLAKDREARPPDAATVAHALQRIEAREWPAPGDEPATLETALPHALPPGRPAPTSTMGLFLRRRRWYGLAAAIVALALAAGSFVFFRTRSPHRVIVARPEVVSANAADPQLGLAASGVLSAELSGLASLEGVAPIDPREASAGGTSPVQMARTLAADEVLASTIEREEGTSGRVSLRRIQGSDGRVLWAQTFKVPTDPESLRLLADSVTIHLRHAYPDQRLRPGTPDLEVRDEDYTAFLEVKNRIDAGETDFEPELTRLEKIARDSPRFLEAKILGSRVAVSLFDYKQDPGYLDRATKLVRQAETLAPNDPRPLNPELRIALALNREPEAEAVLANLERIQPGDSEVQVQRSRIAEHQGRWDDALRNLQTAVERAPSWKNLFDLARVEAQRGHLKEARGHLDAVLRQAPGNEWARERLAGMELDYGDLGRAERLYLDLLRSAPRRNRFTDLGVARFLLGHYTDADAAFRQALGVDPDDPSALIDLAYAETQLGREPEAQDLYRKALARIQKDEPALGLPPEVEMEKAECLAHLGRTREAATLVQDTLRRRADDPDLLYNAALIYSLIGDRNSALSNAQAALEKGKSPRWFTVPAFHSLQRELQPLLQGAPKNQS